MKPFDRSAIYDHPRYQLGLIALKMTFLRDKFLIFRNHSANIWPEVITENPEQISLAQS